MKINYIHEVLLSGLMSSELKIPRNISQNQPSTHLNIEIKDLSVLKTEDCCKRGRKLFFWWINSRDGLQAKQRSPELAFPSCQFSSQFGQKLQRLQEKLIVT